VVTSKKDASKAAKQLTSPKSTPAEKSVAGSDLAQAKGKGAGGTSGKAPQKATKTATGTSPKDASKAAKQLTSPKSTPAEKSVAGSDLAQAKGKGNGGTSGKTTKKK
jgi:hypothetical protein